MREKQAQGMSNPTLNISSKHFPSKTSILFLRGLLNILRQGVFFLPYIKLLLSMNYVPDTVRGIEDTVVKKIKSLPS